MVTENTQQTLIPAKQTRTEIRVANSRFIASAAPAFSVDEAKLFIAKIKQEFNDANHNVPIFIIGHGASVTAHSSDDREPSGTAGRPALAVLSGSGLGDVVVVITRYFGGTKLGTGGLVRAYSAAMRAVLDDLPLAVKIPAYTVAINLPYHYFERVRRLVEAHGGIHYNEVFGVAVTITCIFAVGEFTVFQTYLQELSHGTLAAIITETNQSTIMPLT